MVAAALAVLAVVPAAHAAGRPRVAVLVVPSFDPATYAGRGAVGLLVPGSGTTVTRQGALAALVRGKLRNALVGGVPTGKPLIRLARSPGPVTVYVALPPPGRSHNVHRYPIAIVGGGYRGTLTSTATRIRGLVSVADVAPTAVALARDEQPPIRSSAEADAAGELRALDTRIDRVHDLRVWAMLILIFGTVVLLPTGAALLGPPASITAGLVLSALGVTNAAAVLILLAAATVLVPLALRRVTAWAVVGFLVAFLVVLAVWPETNSLSVIGPHPDGGGRYYGVTNMVETLLLAPALFAGAALGVLPLAALSLVLAGWSRAGADGGAVVVFAAAFTTLALRQRRVPLTPVRVAVGAGIAVAAAAALVGVDLLAGGNDHVTRAVRRGPGSLLGDWGHRIHVSWAGATSSWYSILICVLFGAVLVTLGLLKPRTAAVEAFLVGIAVSLLVNDTPPDVLGFGALGCATLVPPATWRFNRIAAVRRPALLALLALAVTVLAAGCGSGTTVSPTAQNAATLIVTTTKAAKGDATAGKAVFDAQGCGSCHRFTPAKSAGTVGPDLDKLADYAKTAGKPVDAFAAESITSPGAYVEKGYPDGVMPTTYNTLSPQQLADLVAFITQTPK